MPFLKSLIRPLLLTLMLTFGMSYAYAAWNAPSALPPSGNIDTPINTGSIGQVKSGGIGATQVLVNSSVGTSRIGVSGGAGYSAINIGNWSTITNTDGNGRVSWYGNADGNKYLQSEGASRITQSLGSIDFYSAANGTAGNPIGSWLHTLNIAQNGNVNIYSNLYVSKKTTTKDLHVSGITNLDGNTTIGGDLTVAGDSNLGGTATFNNVKINGSLTGGGSSSPWVDNGTNVSYNSGKNTYVGDMGCGAGTYSGISLGNAPSGCTNYNILSEGTNLFLNRPAGGNMYFREGNGTQIILQAGGNTQFMGKIGTNGFDPVAGLPGGWGGGVHTWDVYAEGTIGAGPAGAAPKAWMNHIGNGGFSNNLWVNNTLFAGTVSASKVNLPGGNSLQIGSSYYYGDTVNSAVRQNGNLYIQNPAGNAFKGVLASDYYIANIGKWASQLQNVASYNNLPSGAMAGYGYATPTAGCTTLRSVTAPMQGLINTCVNFAGGGLIPPVPTNPTCAGGFTPVLMSPSQVTDPIIFSCRKN